MESHSENQSPNQSRRTRPQRRRFRNVAQRIVDIRRSMRQFISSQGKQSSASMCQEHEQISVIQPVVEVQPQFSLTKDVITQLATVVANAVRNKIGDAGHNQRHQISNETYHEEEDQTYIPSHNHTELSQQGSDKNRNWHTEDQGESTPGTRYAWYRILSNPYVSSQQGTHTRNG